MSAQRTDPANIMAAAGPNPRVADTNPRLPNTNPRVAGPKRSGGPDDTAARTVLTVLGARPQFIK